MRKMLDEDGAARFKEYTTSSKDTAIMPICLDFDAKNDVSDYIFGIRESAEAIHDSDQPQFIVLIREPGVSLPAPKRELMKIGTRILKKHAPNRTYIFLECEGTQESNDILGAISFFLSRLGAAPEDGPKDWLEEYIYSEH